MKRKTDEDELHPERAGVAISVEGAAEHARRRPEPARVVGAVLQNLHEVDERDHDHAEQDASRYQKRQNHARRRLTTSSSRSRASSVPNRLGHGMTRRRIRGRRGRGTPRRSTIVARIDQPTPQPWCLWNQTNAAGLVRMATNVAARASVAPLLREQVDCFLARKRERARFRHG